MYSIGPYGKQMVLDIDKYLKDMKVEGKDVLVIGTQIPWIELIAVVNKAKTVTTVEYQKIHCEHPKLITMTTHEFNEKFLKNELPKYDVVISQSSIEHSGLGRYGDTLNPWGDIIAMAKAWCVTKPDAKALIGFPVGPKDKIVFNSHKVYGKIMLPHVFANWKLDSTNLDLSKYSDECDWCYEPLFLLSKAQ